MLRTRSLLFCAIGLLLWTGGQAQEPVRIFCDDKDVQAGVDLALVTHNGKLQQGNQFALDQIVFASKVVNESTTLFTLKFLVRESDCPVGGDKEWRDCDYLPQPATVAPSPCTAVVFKNNDEENLKIVSEECKRSVEPMVVRERAHCLGCPENIDVMSEDLKEPVMYSLSKFNAEDDSSHHFLLHEILSARRQVVAGFRYDVRFELEKSNCSKSDFKELTDECHPAENEPSELVNCNSTVYIAPWRREEPEAHLNCERALPMTFSRRRPPGWSPLRHYNYFAAKVPRPASPTHPPTPELSAAGEDQPLAAKPSAAPESSEESQEVTTQSPAPPTTNAPETGPDPALLLELPTAAEPIRPFNCPTKPWKQFVPLTPLPPYKKSPPPPQSARQMRGSLAT